MSEKIIRSLEKLTEVAPDICSRVKFGRYKIGDYQFGLGSNGTLYGSYGAYSGKVYGGPPVMAWLTDAVRRAIEKRGWFWETKYSPIAEGYSIEVKGRHTYSKNEAEVFLDLLTEASIEAKK